MAQDESGDLPQGVLAEAAARLGSRVLANGGGTAAAGRSIRGRLAIRDGSPRAVRALEWAGSDGTPVHPFSVEATPSGSTPAASTIRSQVIYSAPFILLRYAGYCLRRIAGINRLHNCLHGRGDCGFEHVSRPYPSPVLKQRRANPHACANRADHHESR